MAPKDDPTGLAPRRAAWRLLTGVTEEGRTLSDTRLDHLSAPDRARSMRLALTACRELGKADRVLAPFLRKRPKGPLRNLLRLGVVELAGGAPAHGVVNAMVSLAGEDKRTASGRGLINAVLRKAADTVEGWDKLPVPTLPRWLRRPLVEAWGQRAVQRMEHAHLIGAPLDLTARSEPDAVAKATGGPVLPTGSVRLTDPGRITDLAGYASGEWWVQDAAAALPVRMLGPRRGETIVDLCAAPGGKTLQLAAAGAEVTAVDVSEDRLATVAENLARTGLGAGLVACDARRFSGGPFDAVLLDAPCSATGTIRRHPDLPIARDGAEIAGLIALQSDLIDHAVTLLRPGGRLVFCTCSLLPDEGECQVEEALERHPGLAVDRGWTSASWVDPDWISSEGGLRLRPDYWPERGGMDGFYAALLTMPA